MSAKSTVFVTRKLPEAVEEKLARDYDAILNPADELYEPDKLPHLSKNCDGLLVCPTDSISGDVIARLSERIRVIATFSVGYEHIDLEAAKARNILVTNTPDVLNDSTADLTLLLMLGAARRATEGVEMIREGRWQAWSPTGMLGTDLNGKRLGIYGMGGIGRAVAVRAQSFGMEVHYHNRRRLSRESENGAHYHSTADSLLGVSQFLSLHAPLTSESVRFLDKRCIAKLPDGAIVVNTARGDLVVDDDLIDALKSRKVAAAGLDVFAGEPNIHPEYRLLRNAFLLPHMGTSTIETRNAMGFCALRNLSAALAGFPAPNALI